MVCPGEGLPALEPEHLLLLGEEAEGEGPPAALVLHLGINIKLTDYVCLWATLFILFAAIIEIGGGVRVIEPKKAGARSAARTYW